MARVLIIGCGCRGLALGAELLGAGHAVRGTTRHHARLAAIAASGAEPFLADPDRVATLTPALEHVTVGCILLGSATGSDPKLAALHGSRLEMLLTRMLDTTLHGILYEACGSVDREVLRGGARRVERACRDSLIPYRLLEADPADRQRWTGMAVAAVRALLERAAGDPGAPPWPR